MTLGEHIEEPKFIDDATSVVSRGRFARMCIEVDITKPLLSKFKLRRRIRCIEYEGVHLICFKCGVYGNREDQCNSHNHDGRVPENTEQTVTEAREREQASANQKIHERISGETQNVRPEIS